MIVKGRTLPDFMIVGAQKAGTTTLAKWLSLHPEISISHPKEPYFFTAQGQKKPYPGVYIGAEERNESDWVIRDPDAYSMLFQCGTSVSGEASTHYLYSFHLAIENMRRFYGDSLDKVKIIVILRDPVERAFSAWMMLKRAALEPLGFEEALVASQRRINQEYAIDYDYVGFSRYANALRAYARNFERVFTLQTHELQDDYSGYTLRQIFRFLGVGQFTMSVGSKRVHNVGGLPTNDKLYALLVRASMLRKSFRLLVPQRLRRHVRYVLDRRMLEHPFLDAETRERCLRYFSEDQRELKNILNSEKSIIHL